MDGTIGGVLRIPKESLESPWIDIFCNHYYGGEVQLKKDAAYVASFKKVFIASEFGFAHIPWYQQFMKTVLNHSKISGALLWSLR